MAGTHSYSPSSPSISKPDLSRLLSEAGALVQMAAELLGLSKFKLQLLALVSESRHLTERERSAREQLDLSLQRQKEQEAECDRKLQELRTELASRDESHQKLEAKVKYLENENTLLGQREMELKQTINGLLQSKDTFVSQYEDSTSALSRSIAIRDKKLSVLSEKIQAHFVLLDSIHREASSIKQLVDNVQHVVNGKEQTVNGLKSQMEKISAFEKDFVEKICFLENKISDYQLEVQNREIIIMELKEQVEAQKLTADFQPQMEELQKILSVKEAVIQCLTSEKQALHLELHHMELILRRIQDVSNVNLEDQKALSSVLGDQEMSEMCNREEKESVVTDVPTGNRSDAMEQAG